MKRSFTYLYSCPQETHYVYSICAQPKNKKQKKNKKSHNIVIRANDIFKLNPGAMHVVETPVVLVSPSPVS